MDRKFVYNFNCSYGGGRFLNLSPFVAVFVSPRSGRDCMQAKVKIIHDNYNVASHSDEVTPASSLCTLSNRASSN